ncbi:androgen-induced gene 1 protein isoform X9 [Ictidomys tridecemlineatus]|uniref:androgen-induced gene 1 protein isoform X8 n=1 Tax=Ictidomys tridecemlineatus TaxID=43179 RepID=UPI001A9FABB9|nr:androgen-induced gene 1 protein isoform X8 [Ictidomys tridecemlineatus]
MALVPCQVLRVAILLSYCSILCNYKAIEMPSHQTYGGSWKFLTFIDLFVVSVFWTIYACDREMIYPKLLDNFIPGWLNHGMHTTVLPFILIEMRTSHHQYPSRSSGLTAICTFSVGYILWLNVGVHQPQEISMWSTGHSEVPRVRVCWVHHVTGMWVYPFLEHIGPGARIIFFGSTTILMNFLYLLGEVLNNYIWDTQRISEESHHHIISTSECLWPNDSPVAVLFEVRRWQRGTGL